MQEATGSEALQDTINKLKTIDGIVVRLKTDVDNIDVNAVTDERLEEIQKEAQQIESFVSEKILTLMQLKIQ